MTKLFVLMAFFVGSALGIIAQNVPKEIRGGVLNGKAISLPKPEYPETARSAGMEGIVEVEVTIDEGGNVISAVANTEPRKVSKSGKGEDELEVIPAPDVLLREAAEQAAWQARFSPTLLSGVPVKVKGTIVYNFSISHAVAEGSGAPSLSVLTGTATSLPKPKYPPAAAAVRAEGVVSVQVTVDESGKVVSATAVSGHPLLRAAAVAAARAATFEPKIVDGKTVQFSGVVTYNFIAPKPEN